MSVFGNINGVFSALGKPYIKLEFDDNAELLSFQKRMNEGGEAAEAEFEDGEFKPVNGTAGDLGAAGDLYLVRDLRTRARKEPGETVSNKNLRFYKIEGEEVSNFNKDIYEKDRYFDRKIDGYRNIYITKENGNLKDSGLSGYGDFYTVRDNRKRAKKEPGELVANKNLVFTKGQSDIINYNHLISSNNPDYKLVNIERKTNFSENKNEWVFKVGFFECEKKTNENITTGNDYYQKGQDGKAYKGFKRYYAVLVNESDLINLQKRYNDNSGIYYKAYITVKLYNDLKNEAFRLFLDSLKRNITYYEDELRKEKERFNNPTYGTNIESKKKWLARAEENLKNAKKVLAYNYAFYGIKNDSDGLGKTANNALYNDNSIIDCRGFKPTYKILPSYDSFFDVAKNKNTFAGFGLDDTKKLIADTCRKHYKDCEKIAKHLKGDCLIQSAFNLWHWLRHNIRYEYDREGREEVRAPLRTWQDRERGVDCDCLSVFAWCVLKCMGYEPAFELAAFKNRENFSHIYVNCDGIVVDRVWFIFNSRPPLVTKTEIYKVNLQDLGKLF